MAAAKKTRTSAKLNMAIRLLAPRGSVVLTGELVGGWLVIKFLLHFERKYLISHGQ